jgi:hypothetical protein
MTMRRQRGRTDVSVPDFMADVVHNAANRAILSRWHRLDLPDAWLVAGCLFQTVWNLHTGRAPDADIKDYDVFYFDPTDLSAGAEQQAQARVASVFADLGVTFEVANQARVHLWYPAHFGRPYPALASSQDGIGRFLVCETCVGVRPGDCFAPYGLDGLYAGTLTPNPRSPNPDWFTAKTASYLERWPWLTVADQDPGDAGR